MKMDCLKKNSLTHFKHLQAQLQAQHMQQQQQMMQAQQMQQMQVS